MKKIGQFFLGVVLFAGGEYAGYSVFSNPDQSGLVHLFGVLAFCMTYGGMTLIIEIPYSYLNKWAQEKAKTNETIADVICIPMFILVLILFAIPAVFFYHYSGKYHRSQIDNFGVVQQVFIENESHGKNSSNYSYFRFTHNGEESKKWLSTWRYKIGDSAKIIYSTENPNEMEWYEKYLESKK